MSTAPADVRRAARDTQQPLIGGVAAGLARHLGAPVPWVRAAFVITAAMGGLGIAFYAGLWMVLPVDAQFDSAAPGLASATRGGRRPGPIRRIGDVGPVIALAALAFGAVLFTQAVLGRGAMFWPIVIGAAGVALLWRQADEAQRERWVDTSGRIDPVRAVLGRGGWAAYARVAAGITLVLAALALFTLRSGSLAVARDITAAGLLSVLGFGIVAGPWVYRLAADLTAERAERVRTQERADVAAHLHDSVLQTLALIQKNSADSPLVARLARSQERDLRAWLYAEESTDERTVAGALRLVVVEIEDTYGVSVELVTVGDCDLVGSLREVVAATREAVTNAAKHAGTGQVDVYAEISAAAVDVFVRDRGIGFDPTAAPRTGTACATASSGGWPGTAARSRCGPRQVRAPRYACTYPGERSRPMAEHPAPVSVVIVDDHAMFRSGVRSELAPTVEVRAEAADVEGAVTAVAVHRPDVVLLDVHLPGGGGLEVMRRCQQLGHSPDTRYLALSVSDAAEDVIGTVRGGARGYVTKTITGPELVAAIRRVASGDAVFSPRLAGFVLDAFAGSIEVAAVDENLDRLTEREREVMRLIARGYAYKEVARELFITIKTVETHMSNVLRKLQLSSRHELTRWAADRRLL